MSFSIEIMNLLEGLKYYMPHNTKNDLMFLLFALMYVLESIRCMFHCYIKNVLKQHLLLNPLSSAFFSTTFCQLFHYLVYVSVIYNIHSAQFYFVNGKFRKCIDNLSIQNLTLVQYKILQMPLLHAAQIISKNMTLAEILVYHFLAQKTSIIQCFKFLTSQGKTSQYLLCLSHENFKLNN